MAKKVSKAIKPKSGETQDKFISRCMSDSHMKSSFSDKDQRLAVCFSSWRDSKKSEVVKKLEKVCKTLGEFIKNE